MSVTKAAVRTSDERGIALVSALLIVMLVSIVAAGFILRASGERSVSSNVQISRASLLAADAGVRVAQQVLANSAKTQLNSLIAGWSGTGPIITSPSTMFAAGAQTITSSNPAFTATATVAFADSDLAPGAQTYNYRYTITSTGSAGAQGQRQVQSTGILRVSAERGSFADFLLFTQNHTTAGGGEVWFTTNDFFDGRVHTNGQFRFAYQPSFQDQASSVNAKAWYYNNDPSNHVELAANSNGTIDTPIFYGGFRLGAPAIPMPANGWDQQNAALGRTPDGNPPSDAEINMAIGLGALAVPPAPGIYVVNNGTALTGGVYVQGNLSHFEMRADTVQHRQVLVLTHATLGSKTITVDRVSHQTTVQGAIGAPVTYLGDSLRACFVNGGIADLRGPDRVSGNVPPALEASTQFLVTATGDIVIERDITCEDYNDAGNVLGLFSSGGSVRIGSSAPNDMNLDAFVLCNGPTGSFLVDNHASGAPRGAFRLRGGVAETYYGPFFVEVGGTLQSGYWRDWHYDRRGVIPPFYPKTNRFNADNPTARTLAWKEL